MSQLAMDFEQSRCFHVIRSSAGSGKTTVLVQRYLELALGNDRLYFRHLLAVTFTNKAAGEMKDRILELLTAFANQPSNKWTTVEQAVGKYLTDALGIGESELRNRASILLRTILHRYAEFRVETIDSFFHGVIRSFAFDLRLSRNFVIEMDQDFLLSLATDDLLNACGRDEELTRLLEEFVAYRLDEEATADIERAIQEAARAVVEDAETRRQLPRLLNVASGDWIAKIRTLTGWLDAMEDKIKRIARQGVDIIEQIGIPPEKFSYAKTGIGFYFIHLAQAIPDDGWEPNSRVMNAASGDWFSKTNRPFYQKHSERLEIELVPLFRRMERLWTENSDTWITAKSALKSAHTVALFSAIRLRMDTILKKRQSIHVSDLAHLVHAIVMEEPIPFIYERVGSVFFHYLIDEFQDTSAVQFQNFLPLLDHSIATGKTNVVVGDSKQSIYRWRGADWEQFENLPDLKLPAAIPWQSDWAATIYRSYCEEKLVGNYRSRPAIVKFNNHLYEFVRDSLGEGNPYRNVHQDAMRPSTGYVGIRWDFLQEDPIELRGAHVLQSIQQCQADGFQLRDIALLFRKNDQAERWAKFLIENGLAVISPDSLLLDRQPEVLFLVSVLEWMLHPSDPLACGQMMLLLCDVRDDVQINTETLRQAVRSWKDLESWFQRQGMPVPELRGYSLYEQLGHIIVSLGLDANGAVVSAFLDIVLDFSTHFGNSTADFLEWWNVRSNPLPILIPSGVDALRVMTIHKAKGLEFPVVMLPECDWPASERQRRPTWIERSEEPLDALSPLYVGVKPGMREYEGIRRAESVDMANLLYVATTRSEERLYIYANFRDPKSTRATAGKLIQDFLESSHVTMEGVHEWSDGQLEPYTPTQQYDEARTRDLSFVTTTDFHDRLKIRMTPNPVFSEDDRRSFGDIFHRVLAHVTIPSDIPHALDHARRMGLDETRMGVLSRELARVTNDAAGSEFFKEGLRVRNEYEMILPDGRLGRVDKLIDDGDQWIIVEYKTGRPSTDHETQIQEYLSALHEIVDRPVRGYLFYTDTLVCQEIR